MSLLRFIHHLLDPHCPDCRAEAREKREEARETEVSLAVETLQRQLEIANHEKEQLLDRLLKEPEKETPRELPASYVPPRTIPWNMRRQMLESEDRRKAQLMRSGAAQPDRPAPVVQTRVEDLEKELGVDDGAEDKETKDNSATAEG